MEVLEFKPINDFAAELMIRSHRDSFLEIIDFITMRSAQLLGADRSCLILAEGPSFVIKGGFPKDGHGVGQRLTAETGSGFLGEVIKTDHAIPVINPAEDARTFYMKPLAERYGIEATLFVPLFHNGDSLGVFVLDYIKNGKKFNKDYRIFVRYIAHHIVQALLAEKIRRQKEERIRHLERLCTVGENAARFAHTIRNKLTIIGGFSGRLLKSVSTCSSCDGKEYAQIIHSEGMQLETTVKGVLMFAKPVKVTPKQGNINKFLEEFISNNAFLNVKFEKKLDKKLECISVFFDGQKLSAALLDLVVNAMDAQADKIWVKSHRCAKSMSAVICVGNSGQAIDLNMRQRLFEPFMSSKADGTGLGLANVKLIIEAHSGEIAVESNQEGLYGNSVYKTEFKISLPLRNN